MKTSQRFLAAASVAGFLLLGAGGVVVAGVVTDAPRAPDGYSGAAPDPGDRPESKPARDAVAAPRTALGVAILERPRTVADRLPEQILRGPLLSDRPAIAAQARRVTGRKAWIAPSADGVAVCLIAPGELACPPRSAIARQGAAFAFGKHVDTPYRVTAIAADSVTSATVIAHDGSEHRVAVVDNHIEYETRHRPRGVRWEGPAGPQELRLPDVRR